jgi:hypothetical protein
MAKTAGDADHARVPRRPEVDFRKAGIHTLTAKLPFAHLAKAVPPRTVSFSVSSG